MRRGSCRGRWGARGDGRQGNRHAFWTAIWNAAAPECIRLALGHMRLGNHGRLRPRPASEGGLGTEDRSWGGRGLVVGSSHRTYDISYESYFDFDTSATVSYRTTMTIYNACSCVAQSHTRLSLCTREFLNNHPERPMSKHSLGRCALLPHAPCRHDSRSRRRHSTSSSRGRAHVIARISTLISAPQPHAPPNAPRHHHPAPHERRPGRPS